MSTKLALTYPKKLPFKESSTIGAAEFAKKVVDAWPAAITVNGKTFGRITFSGFYLDNLIGSGEPLYMEI